MSKPLVVIADLDEHYLSPLVFKLVENLRDTVDFEVITDDCYYEKFFSVPRNIDIFVVCEDLYDEMMRRHNITNVFLLCEISDDTVGDSDVHRLFKYSGTQEIIRQIMHGSQAELNQVHQKETQVIVSYSPIGGAGKTTAAIGVAANLSQEHNRVLYIDAEHVQSFQFYIEDDTPISAAAYRSFKQDNSAMYLQIKKHFKKELFDYMPPFCAAMSALNIKHGAYKQLIEQVRRSGDYDYIVVDVDSVFDDEKASLLYMADKVIVLMGQDLFSVFKLKQLLKNVNCTDKEKYIGICNKFDENTEDEIKKAGLGEYIQQYVNVVRDKELLTIGDILAMEELHKLAYMLE